MESVDRSYICRKKGKDGKPHRDYGKKFQVTQFDNHLVCERNFSREDIALARAIVHYFTYHYYKKEDERNGTSYYPGKGIVEVFGNHQSNPSPTKERKRAALCKPKQNRTGLSGRKIYGVDKPKLHNREE